MTWINFNCRFPKTEKWKHKEVSLDEVFKGCVLFLEAAMLEPETQVNGAVVIFDMDGLSLQQTWQFTPPFAKRIVDWLQDSVPLRIKGIHIVNQPKIFQMVFALFKPFLREKLRNRIIFHGTDRESLHKHIEPKCLPMCYDGTIDLPVTFKIEEEWRTLLQTFLLFHSSALMELSGSSCSWNVIRNTWHSMTMATSKSEKPRLPRNATRVRSVASPTLATT